MAEIAGELRRMPNVGDHSGLEAEMAERRGRLSALPPRWRLPTAIVATWIVATAIVATWAAGAGIVFTPLRYVTP